MSHNFFKVSLKVVFFFYENIQACAFIPVLEARQMFWKIVEYCPNSFLSVCLVGQIVLRQFNYAITRFITETIYIVSENCRDCNEKNDTSQKISQ